MSDLIDKWCSLKEIAEYFGVIKATIRIGSKDRCICTKNWKIMEI